MKIHRKITAEAVIDACERRMNSLDNPGFCISCGNEAEGVDPDARNYECDACGRLTVYGCEELAIMML